MAKDKSFWEAGGRRRYVLNPDDVQDLERESGVHEFVGRNPRNKAEDMAYGEYTKRHHKEAAAHHLTHMKAAQANGNYSDAKRHKILYDMHIKEMGLDDTDGKVPTEIAEHMQNPDAPRPIKFKPHKADTFFLSHGDKEEGEHSMTKSEIAAKLAETLKRVLAKNADAGGTIPSNMQSDFGMSDNYGDHAWNQMVKAMATGPQTAAPGVTAPAPDDFEDTVDTAIPENQRAWRYSSAPITLPGKKRVVLPGKVAKKAIDPKDLEEGSADEQDEHNLGPTLSTKIAADHLKQDPGYYSKKAQDPDDHGNPKEIAQDRAEDKREEAAYRKEQDKRYGSDEPTYKGEKPYTGRDEGIRRSKLPPGAPGASKDGVGVQVDKKKEAARKAARGKVREE